jgi:hypothetical protein
MSQSAFCVGCGTAVHPEAKFCQACGAEQPIGVAPAPASDNAAPAVPLIDVSTPTAPLKMPESPQPVPGLSDRAIVVGLLAIGAAVAAWFGENAAIHAMGYSGFGGPGWITAIMIPLGAAAGVWDKLGGGQ